MNRSPQSFIALGKQVDELQRITADIDNYNLGQIKLALTTAAILSRHAQTEYQAQYEAWISVKNEATKDKETFLQLRRRLDEVQRLQDEEIVRLNRLLDEATRPSLIADTMDLLLTFVLGVLSSIISSHLSDLWMRRKQASSK